MINTLVPDCTHDFEDSDTRMDQTTYCTCPRRLPDDIVVFPILLRFTFSGSPMTLPMVNFV